MKNPFKYYSCVVLEDYQSDDDVGSWLSWDFCTGSEYLNNISIKTVEAMSIDSVKKQINNGLRGRDWWFGKYNFVICYAAFDTEDEAVAHVWSKEEIICGLQGKHGNRNVRWDE